MTRLLNWIEPHQIFEGINFKPDADIKHPSRDIWEFEHEGITYIFRFRTIGNVYGKNTCEVFFNRKDKKTIERTGSKTTKMTLFSLVFTCMVYFIRQENPDRFNFLPKDSDLGKFFNVMWLSRHKKTPELWKYVRDERDLEGGDERALMIFNYHKDSLLENCEPFSMSKEEYDEVLKMLLEDNE